MKFSANAIEKVRETCTESNLDISDSNVDRAHRMGKVCCGRIKKVHFQSKKKSSRRKSIKLDLTKGGI